MAGHPAARVGVLGRAQRRGPCGIEVARQIQRAGVAGEGGHEDRLGGRSVPAIATARRPSVTASATSRSTALARTMLATASTYGPTRSGCSSRRPVGEVQEAPALDGVADHRRRGRRADGQLRMRDHLVVREGLDPAEQRPRPAGPHEREVGVDEQPGDERVVARGGAVLDGLDEEARDPEPSRGAPVDRRDLVRLRGGELEGGELGEERVHAVPAAVLEPGDEQVRALELGQDLRGVRPAEDVVGELHGEPAQDRGAQEERADSASSAPIASALR